MKRYSYSGIHPFFFLFGLLLLIGCTSQEPPHAFSVIEINGRNGVPIYRIEIPLTWAHRLPAQGNDLTDTMLPLCEVFITENDQKIRITIYNFPVDHADMRIPPSAQIHRWKQQFEQLEMASVSIISQSFSGFNGLLFEGSGILHQEDATMMGWSMQLAPEHYRNLAFLENYSTGENYREQRADITIKAVGPAGMMKKYRADIHSFARHFELIQELPPST